MSKSMIYILVTGTNGGLGLGICTRLIDDFLHLKPTSCSLTLIFTTRSTRKGTETLNAFHKHLSSNHPPEASKRVHFQPENVELTNLLSIHALSQKLIASNVPYLNAIILNAGIGGWVGMDWVLVYWDVLRNIVVNTTWPRYKLGVAGLITDKQFPDSNDTRHEEPPLGQIFCANVFGHYMLVHWLMPLVRACESTEPCKVIWVSSIEPRKKHLNEDDVMGLRTRDGYESSKRFTDVLALTYGADATKRAVRDFISVDETSMQRGSVKREVLSVPTMHVAHPGVCISSIVSLNWFNSRGYMLGIYLARLAGNPWSTFSTYLAALTFVWLALAPADEINEQETRFGSGSGGGRVKWGTAVTRLGQSSSRPTDVEGWGIAGDGKPFKETWWGGGYGRVPGSVDAKREDVEDFTAQGGRIWEKMETMRKEWEARIEDYGRASTQK